MILKKKVGKNDSVHHGAQDGATKFSLEIGIRYLKTVYYYNISYFLGEKSICAPQPGSKVKFLYITDCDLIYISCRHFFVMT